MSHIADNLAHIKQTIEETTQHYGRAHNSVRLVAVSKTKPVSQIEAALAAGQTEFGENYVQEGVDKISYFQQSWPDQPITWHFIGPLQSNKTKLVAAHFDWIHTIDRIKIAERLSQQRPAEKGPLNMLIQINISDEASKSGIAPDAMLPLAEQIAKLGNCQLRGLMAIPAPTPCPERQLATFEAMAGLFQQLQRCYPAVDTLSMGMSEDLRSAIAAGSTLVRVGSAIFGARDPVKNP